MPPQTSSDQAYAEQARWNEAPQQARWNETPQQPRWNGAPAQPRWNGARAEEGQTQAYVDQEPPSAPPAPPAAPRSPMSRRSVLRGVAGVGVVGAAAAAGAGAVVAINRQGDQTLTPASKPVAMAPMAPSAMEGPLVVYIADTTNGLLDVFGGTGQTRVHNPALVKQLLANIKLA